LTLKAGGRSHRLGEQRFFCRLRASSLAAVQQRCALENESSLAGRVERQNQAAVTPSSP
jgi:hypothetical protein